MQYSYSYEIILLFVILQGELFLWQCDYAQSKYAIIPRRVLT